MKKSKIYDLDDESFIKLFNESYTFGEMLQKIGLTINGSCSRTVLFVRIKELNLDPKTLRQRTLLRLKELGKRQGNKISLEDVFSGKIRISTHALKNKLLSAGLMEYKCQKCGIYEWTGERLSLQLDHIDGNKLNNKLDNLRLLCPNCHSLTSTFCGKNSGKKTEHLKNVRKCSTCDKKLSKKTRGTFCRQCMPKVPRKKRLSVDKKIRSTKVPHPTKEELETLVWSKPSSLLKNDLGVSDSAIGKWCKKLGVNKPPRGYWAKLDAGRITEEEVRHNTS